MAKFIVKQTATGFKFDLKCEDTVLATSEVYSSENACRKGVDSVRNSAVGEVENQTVEEVLALVDAVKAAAADAEVESTVNA